MNKNILLDWLALNEKTEDAFHHLKMILQQGFTQISVLPSAEQEEQLWAAYWEQRAAQRLKGQQLLFFQYPYFQVTETGEKNLQPLLRWPCYLTPPAKGSTEWTIKILKSADVEPTNALPSKSEYNKAWCVWANQQFKYDWALLLHNCLQAGEQALKNLSVLAQSMMEQTNWETTTVHPALRSHTSIAYNKEDKIELLWMATIGVSTDQWEALEHENIEWHDRLEQTSAQIDRLNLLKLDPFQYKALKHGQRHRFSLIKGHASSGKTHTLIESVKAALLSGKPALIVAKNKASLKNIQQRLRKENLGELTFHWHNEATDLTVFQTKIRAANKITAPIATKDWKQWMATSGRLNRSRRSLGELYAAARRPVLKNDSWSELLGQYLEESRKEGKELLASQLTAASFQFTSKEFNEIKSSIYKTWPLYKEMDSIHHPLSNLNASIFVHQSLEESKLFIEQNADRFLTTAKALHQNYVRRQSQYADQLATHYESHYIKLREQLQALDALLEDGKNEFGKDVLASGQNTLKLYSRFSKRFKKAVHYREKVLKTYQGLQTLHEELDGFKFEWPSVKLNKIGTVLEAVAESYQEALQNWRTTFSGVIQNECLRLNHKTALPALKVSAAIMPMEEALEVFIDELNASGLYQLPLHSKTLTLSRQQKYLEDIIVQLEQSKSGLQTYDVFYYWQCNWFSLTELSRKTIQALLRSQPDDWQAAFASWYMNECLSQNYHPFPIVKNNAIPDYMTQMEELRSRLSVVIYKKWEKQYNTAIVKLKKLCKTELFSVEELFNKGGKYLPFYYPIALASPEMARKLAPYYKLVYLEDAQTLSAAAILPISEYCQQMTAFVDPNEDTFLNNSITQFLSKKGVSSNTLTGNYQLNFAQQALALGKNIVFHELEGRFNEADQSNEVEAFAVLKILNSIQKTPQHTYPSVGVITMTSGQRNKIQSLFYRIKKDRLNGVEMLQQLERNGLKVLTGDEVPGQHFDHIVFSTVHAPIDIKGHLSPQLAALNQGVQKANLAAIENAMRPNTCWDVLCSMPDQELKERMNWLDKKGEQKFGYLLTLLKHIAQGADEEAYTTSKYWDKTQLLEEKNTLATELQYRLAAQLPDWSFAFSRPSGVDQSFIEAQAPNGKKAALLPDGFIANSTYTTLDWEHEQQQRLALSSYHILRFSTEGLWKDPSFTCLRLVNQLSALADNYREEE